MPVTINNINTAVSTANFIVSKIFPLGGILTAPAALVTQAGATSLAVVNQSSQAEAEFLGLNFEVDASVLSLTAKIDGFILAMGTAATYGTGARGLNEMKPNNHNATSLDSR